MKKSYFILLVTCALISACSQSETQDETDTPVAPKSQKVKITFDGESAVSTRTSLSGSFPSTGTGNVTYKWESGDKIFVNDNTSLTANSSSFPSQIASFSGDVANAETYSIYYTGKNSTAYNSVTIPDVQTQVGANNSAHLGTCGDCGSATAILNNATGNYSFILNHKSSYLCFLPRTTKAGVSFKSVKVTTQNPIAGTFSFNGSDLSNGTNTSNTIILKVNDATGVQTTLPLTSSSNQANNATIW